MDIFSPLTEQEIDILKFINNAQKYIDKYEDKDFPFAEMTEMVNNMHERPEFTMSIEESSKYLLKHGYIDEEYQLTVKGKRHLDFLEGKCQYPYMFQKIAYINIYILNKLREINLFKLIGANFEGGYDMKKIIISTIAIIITIIGLFVFNNNVNAKSVMSNSVISSRGNETIDMLVNTLMNDMDVEAFSIRDVQTTDQQVIEEPIEDKDTNDIDQIDIKELDKTMYAQGNANTRSGDSTDYAKVGSLTTNQAVHVIGQSTATGWYQIEINGEEQFVSDRYLADSKITVTTNSSSTGSGEGSNSSNSGTNNSNSGSGETINGRSMEDIINALGGSQTDPSTLPRQEYVDKGGAPGTIN